MIKIGMIIGERYEILEKIGTGGMSDVYKGLDHKLNRMVAVKVLKQEFSENANFVSKFRTEAQAAAGLAHPNIVNVYDVGDEKEIYYIVMELVEGITLKKYIEKKARLSVKEAITIAIQICLGIEAAHNNHIIHRDIKPQNVIISKDGKVKVTDFGIAKAATSNTITSNVMGSVHYTSPEQARGGFSDEKSDIYSLGITLFEMLTGRVPFNGDTTVAIAIKQIQEEMPSPREYVYEIPISIEQIVLKCTQKSPDRRYQNMGELIADLKRSFTNPDEDFVRIATVDEMAATRPISPEELASIKNYSKPSSLQPREEITGTLPKAPKDEDEDDDYDPTMTRVMTVLAIIVGVIICVVAILLICKVLNAANLSKNNHSSASDSVSSGEIVEMVVMPQVVDLDYYKAEEILRKAGLKVKAKYVESDTVKAGIVIAASERDGLKVKVGTTVELTVSAGAKTVVVPDVVGKTQQAATKDLMDKNFTVKVEEDYHDSAKGTVFAQSPEGASDAPENAEITIFVSKGPKDEMVLVPGLINKLEEEAVLEIIEANLEVGSVTQVYNNIVAEGYVCYQNLGEGTPVEKGTKIDIQISKGPEPVAEEKYYFKGEILQPTRAEITDQDGNLLYESGNEITVTITAMRDGAESVLFETTTKSFPIKVELNNITGASKGLITMTFTYTVTDVSSGESTIKTGTITREIEFVKEK